MFPSRYFADRYFAPRYFPKVGEDPIPFVGTRGIRFGGHMLTKEIQGGGKGASDIKFSPNVSSAGGAATVTLAGIVGRRHLVHEVHWSYNTTPTGGGLTITGGSGTFAVDIPGAGPDSLHMSYVGNVGADVVITLAAGGGAVSAKLNVGYTVEH